MAIFTNQATLSYNGLSTNSNIATGEIVEVLSMTKTSLTDTYDNDENVTYVITLTNTGPTELTNLTVTDDLGGYNFNGNPVYPLSYTNESARLFINGAIAPVTATAGPPLTFTGVSVPAGGNAVIVYEADSTGFAPLEANGNITNTATATGAGLTAPVTALDTITVNNEPNLAITKAITPSTVTENSRVTYTFTIQNFGNAPAEAAAAASITDTFNPILENIAVSIDGAPATITTDYTYNEATGQFTTVPGRIVVPAATFNQDQTTGEVTTTPGTTIVTVTGTI